MSFYEMMKKKENARKQSKIRAEGEAAMAEHTKASKNMRLGLAKKEMASKGGLSSQSAGAKIQLASMGAQALSGSQATDQGQGNTNTASSAVDSAAQGAMLGAQFGGVKGALIGGGIGAVKGVLGASSARKRQKAQAQADHQARLANIEGQKTERLQNAFQSLSQAFNASLLR
jgi:hypothetical protein